MARRPIPLDPAMTPAVLGVATAIRQLLDDTFPDHPNAVGQCKRFAILFDHYARRVSWPSYPTAGWIARPGDPRDHTRGHVWTVVAVAQQRMVLDGTLTAFADDLSGPIPRILWMPWADAQGRWAYHDDGQGPYRYDAYAIRPDLVAAVQSLPDPSRFLGAAGSPERSVSLCNLPLTGPPSPKACNTQGSF